MPRFGPQDPRQVTAHAHAREGELLALFGLSESILVGVTESTDKEVQQLLDAVDSDSPEDVLRTVVRFTSLAQAVSDPDTYGNLAKVHFDLVVHLFRAGAPEIANTVSDWAALFEEGLGHSPNGFAFRRLRAILAIRNGRLEDADELLASAAPTAERLECPASHLLTLAALLVARGDLGESRRIMDRGLEMAARQGYGGVPTLDLLLRDFANP